MQETEAKITEDEGKMEESAVEESTVEADREVSPESSEKDAVSENPEGESVQGETGAETLSRKSEAAQQSIKAPETVPENEKTSAVPETASEKSDEKKPSGTSMGDLGKDLEKSYRLMGDGVHDTDTLIAWSKIMELYESGADIEVEVSGIVNKGAIALVEGIRGFIPASRLSLRRVDDLNDWLGRKIKVRIITADKDKDKLVLSAREILREARDEARKSKIEEIKVGSVFSGKVESIQDYGAFVSLGDDVSGLVHVSQISAEHVKHPAAVLKEGQEVRVKVIGKPDGKIKLSMKALEESKRNEEERAVSLTKAESIGTSMGDLLKNIKLPE